MYAIKSMGSNQKNNLKNSTISKKYDVYKAKYSAENIKLIQFNETLLDHLFKQFFLSRDTKCQTVLGCRVYNNKAQINPENHFFLCKDPKSSLYRMEVGLKLMMYHYLEVLYTDVQTNIRNGCPIHGAFATFYLLGSKSESIKENMKGVIMQYYTVFIEPLKMIYEADPIQNDSKGEMNRLIKVYAQATDTLKLNTKSFNKAWKYYHGTLGLGYLKKNGYIYTGEVEYADEPMVKVFCVALGTLMKDDWSFLKRKTNDQESKYIMQLVKNINPKNFLIARRDQINNQKPSKGLKIRSKIRKVF